VAAVEVHNQEVEDLPELVDLEMLPLKHLKEKSLQYL
jgi:hypothetical protein